MIEQLEYLIALSRERHFGRAAKACGVTQPTLSAGLKQLERQLGVLLVLRGARFRSFTPEGERVLDWARRIVADSRAMREDVRTLKKGLSGHLTIAAIPTALPMIAMLTTPYRVRHPDVSFTIISRTSAEIFDLIQNLEADVGLTYLDDEPLRGLRSTPLYHERYQLLLAADSPLGDRDVVSWTEAGSIPLCLLTPDMQNRRIIDRYLHSVGARAVPMLESNSMIVLFAHVRTGQWASILPSKLVETLGLPPAIRAIPITPIGPAPTIGMVVLDREPFTPLIAALQSEVRRLALDD